jgi:spermidine synthase
MHPQLRFPVLVTAAVLMALWAMPGVAAPPRGKGSAGTVEFDKKSDYSHIRVRRQGTVRSLIFVRDSGEEAEETMVNTKRPYELLVPYTRFLFASYLFQPKPQQVLIVGLGGGAMVHFLKHYDPKVRVDVVEIDPLVVEIADRYFDVRSDDTVKIITTDGLEYLQKTENRYDVIYMDAFLKPAADTDATGVPLRMKTARFYKTVQEKLAPGGVVAFNLNRHKSTDADLSAIRSAFGQVYVFRVPPGNLVVVASPSDTRETSAALHARAKDADQRLKATFSFQEMAGRAGK